jgi:hypothetical protein
MPCMATMLQEVRKSYVSGEANVLNPSVLRLQVGQNFKTGILQCNVETVLHDGVLLHGES